jgi:hypothetical protein
MPINVTCGSCGSDNLASRDIVSCSADVISGQWTRAANGDLQAEFTGDTDVHWDSQRVEDEEYPYYCRSCDTDLRLRDLVADDVPQPPDEEDDVLADNAEDG